jgi:arginyl-tRNA synthetase
LSLPPKWEPSLVEKIPDQVGNDSEKMLMRYLLHYGEYVELAASEYKPNLLCNYLYELASLFNRFYQEVPVLQEKDEQLQTFRINLITATAQVIRNGLFLLGIEAPEIM